MTSLQLPDNPRAAKLIVQYDERYEGFLETLPTGLSDLGHMKSTFSGIEEDDHLRGFSQMNPGLTCTPWMFWEIFHKLDDESFLLLAEAGGLIVLASVLLDHLVDGQVRKIEEIILLQLALYQAGLQGFRSYFPSVSQFWDNFERLEREHLQGLSAEIESRYSPNRFTHDEFLGMVRGKFAPIVITVAAFTEATQQGGFLAQIENSIKSLAVASQLLDDLGDWKDDLEQMHLTFYLSSLASPEAWQNDRWPSIEIIQAKIDETWSDVDYLRMVIHWLDESVEAVSELECPAWVNYLDGYRSIAKKHSDAVVARHIHRSLDELIK